MLRTVTSLSPVLRNETRWSSVYAMVARYIKLEPSQLDHGTITENGLEEYLLMRRETEAARALLVDLQRMEGVTKTLQKTTLTMSGVRRLFDRVLTAFPQLENRLAPAAPIVNYSSLESGIVKLQRNDPLSATERSACASFKADDPSTAGEAEEPAPSFVRDPFKRRRVVRRQRYMDVAFIPPTSNECERFFSAAKLVLTDTRKCMDPMTFETLMFLGYNRDLWDVYSVEAIRNEFGENARD